MKFLSFIAFVLLAINSTYGQCEVWHDSPQKEDAENAHTIYRQALKSNDIATAFENWKIAYDIAPAADGLRDFHYTDGIKIYKELLKSETDEAKKAEYKEIITRLYDECIECYKQGVIQLKNCDEDCYQERIGILNGRKGFDMFYTLNSSYSPNLEALVQSLELSGNSAEYIVFEPVANIVVYQYQKEKMSKEEAIDLHEKIVAVAEYNIENNKQYGQYYESALARMEAKYAEIEAEIFDCEFFKEKLLPKYKANPTDPETVQYIYSKLLAQGCDKEDPEVAEIKKSYEEYAAKINAEKQAEFERNNPGVLAKRLYDEGDFNGAIEKYKEAIEKEEDEEKQAEYYFSMASIQFRKLNQYSTARSTALKAAKLKKDWGRPYMLIGDMYGKTSRSCGDNWNQRLAVLAAIDKYQLAKSIDPSVADEANRKIGIYSKSKPAKEDAFMQGYKEKQLLTVGCWIGEKVRLRF